jgi:NAD(P)-dependent dehydrogenase (short-subunit alcohol dehydrogenase family)
MKVALTGGASGIGAAVAAALKIDGHHVTAFDISEPQENVDRWVETDLSDPASIKAAIDAADGPYDALINNAGLPPRDGLAKLVLRVNFFGLRAFMDGMCDNLSDGGAIVNVASRAGAQWRDNLEEVKALIALDPANLADFIAAPPFRQHVLITCPKRP